LSPTSTGGARDRHAGAISPSRRRWATGIAAVLAFVLVACSSSAAEQADPVSPRRRLVAAIETDLTQHADIPGEAVSVRAPGLDIEAARGFADVAMRAPLRTDTPFRIASVTKTFVAAAVLRLVEQDKVGLDEPIARYLPDATIAILTAGGYRPEQITVRQLLNHTSGLFDYASSDAYDALNVQAPGRRWTAPEQLQFAMDHGRPVAAPGHRYHYADTNYLLAGEILERATGIPLAQAVRNLVGFQRLRLARTYWERLEPTPTGLPPRAHQYYDRAFDNITLDASSDLYGGGGLVSTVGDLTRFFRGLFGGRVFDRDATLETMLTVTRAARNDGAGLGIFRTRVAGETCWGHPGYWGTIAFSCPRLDLDYAIETNQANEADLDTTALERTIIGLASDGTHE
jgi:D-alanyl-D-alanine carboxypeptidase